MGGKTTLGKTTLKEILRRTLVGYPCALALLGTTTSCVPNEGACGSQVVLIQRGPDLPDGGLDCSACASYGAVIGCNPATMNSESILACNVEYFCGGITGRRPAWLVDARPGSAPGAGAYFALAARLEAASVPAFRALARELSAHRAPAALASWARQSAVEETRHARLMAAAARRYGSTPLAPVYSETPPVRTLEEIAVENAVEGCVRESFGAALAMVQARHAKDEAVAATLATVARDEIGHAELGWAAGEWMNARLAPAARERVNEARFRAASALAEELPAASPALRHITGLLSDGRHAELAARFGQALRECA